MNGRVRALPAERGNDIFNTGVICDTLTARDGGVSDCSSAVQCIRGSHIAVESVAVWDDLQLHRHTNNCSVQSVTTVDSGIVNVPAGNMVFSDVIFLPGEGTRPG